MKRQTIVVEYADNFRPFVVGTVVRGLHYKVVEAADPVHFPTRWEYTIRLAIDESRYGADQQLREETLAAEIEEHIPSLFAESSTRRPTVHVTRRVVS